MSHVICLLSEQVLHFDGACPVWHDDYNASIAQHRQREVLLSKNFTTQDAVARRNLMTLSSMVLNAPASVYYPSALPHG